MRAIIQRVLGASVTVGGEKVSEIGRGLCVLVGISREDTQQEMEYMVKKILNLKLFDGENEKRWAKSVMDKQYEVLCVSQFTLYSILKGNKPDFHEAMGPDTSKDFYEEFFQKMKIAYKPDKLKDGLFGEYMQVNIQNDGPVTITVDSPVFSQQEKDKFFRKLKLTKEREAKSRKWYNDNDKTSTVETNSSSNDRGAANLCTGESQASEECVTENMKTLHLQDKSSHSKGDLDEEEFKDNNYS